MGELARKEVGITNSSLNLLPAAVLGWGPRGQAGVECPEESGLLGAGGRTPGGSRGCEERVCLTGHEGCLGRGCLQCSPRNGRSPHL